MESESLTHKFHESTSQCPFLSAEPSNSPSQPGEKRSVVQRMGTMVDSMFSFFRKRVMKPAPRVAYRHLLLYYLLSMFTITMLVFNSANTVFLLNIYLHTPKEQQGSQSGDLGFAQEIMILCSSFLWGLASDFVGRAFVFATGFWMMSSALILSSWMSTFTSLLLVRLLFACGAAACTAMMTALLGDYVSRKDRGKGGGMLGFVSGLGAVIAAMVLLRLSSWIKDFAQTDDEAYVGHIVYAFIGISYVLLGLLALLGLKSPNRKSLSKYLLFWRQSPQEESQLDRASPLSADSQLTTHHKEYTPIITSEEPPSASATSSNTLGQRVYEKCAVVGRHTLKALAATRHPPIFLSYCASFVARADSAIITSFLTLWVAQQMREEHPGISDSAATARGGLVSGIAQTAALVTAPLWGLLADKIHYTHSLNAACILSGIGYMSMSGLSSVTHGLVFLPVTLIGMGEIGVIIVSQGLVTRHVSKDILGSVSGIFTLCGGLGILVCTKLGGYMFDHVSPGAMFFAYGVSNVMLAGLSMCVFVYQVCEGLLKRFMKRESEAAEVCESPVEKEQADSVV